MAVKKGGPKRLERKQPPPASLGRGATSDPTPESLEKASGSAQGGPAYHIQAAAAAAATQAHSASSKANRKRGQSKSASAQKKRERGVDMAARLAAKAAKRTERTDKRKRAKEVPR